MPALHKDENKKRQENELKRRLRKEAMKEFRPIALGSIAMVASSISNQAVPRLLGKLLDQKTATSTTSDSCSETGGGILCPSTLSSLALVVLGGGAASFIRTTMLNRAEDNITSRLRSQAFHSLLLSRNMEWFQVTTTTDAKEDEKNSSDQPEKTNNKKCNTVATGMSPGAIGIILNEDVTTVAGAITSNLANLIRSSCSCLFGAYNMLQLNTGIFGVAFSVVPLIGTAAIVLHRFIRNVTERQREAATLAASFADERLTHIGMVKMSNRELDEVDYYTNLQKDVLRLGRSASVASGAFMGFIFAASSGALFMVFDAGGKAVASGRMTPGELTSFATYTFLLGLGTSGIFRALGKMTEGLVSAERVYQLIDGEEQDSEKQQEIKSSTSDTKVAGIESIRFSNVEFAYKNHKDSKVLKGVSLELKRGKVVALCGKNGSGKSTIASLLAAFYTPQSGSIVLSDGTDYLSLDRSVQKQLVQVVPQSPALFNTSILENVRYSNPQATDTEVRRAMAAANCDFVNSLEDGMQYTCGQNGCKLSGGQCQRISLARALLADPAVLVLDEPTSAMDVEGTTAVADAVAACRGGTPGRALLLISHKQSSLEMADAILVLKDGQIVEEGTFKELSQKRDSELCLLMPDLRSNGR